MEHALVIDDESEAAEMMAALIANEGYTVATAGTLAAARQRMAMQAPSLVLLDLSLPDGSGWTLFEELELMPRANVVLCTGHATVESSIRALRANASDYLTKPVNMTYLRDLIARLKRPLPPTGAERARAWQEEVRELGRFGRLWGRSAAMCSVYEQLAHFAPSQATVFVTGESGTGKELVARTVHELSRRSDGPFLAVNCGAISATLIETELFGHERGSFTGAERTHQGFFERAHGGTLFLDEITEMPPDLQVKLLRVLETGSFQRVGAMRALQTDVRIVAASNRDPERAVQEGCLREDLYYRLKVLPLHLPPLRERREDIAPIARQLLREVGEREGGAKTFTAAALELLAAQPWPGNVRQLRNAVQRAYVLAPQETIGVEQLSMPHASPASHAPHAPHAPYPPPSPLAGSAEPVLALRLGTPLAELERQVILATLAMHGQRRERTAAALGISLKTLYNRLRAYAIDDEGPGAGEPAC